MRLVKAGEKRMSLIEVVREPPVTTVWLNRPEKLNALAGTMRQDLAAAFTAVASDPDVSVVVLAGRGRGFCAGGDREVMARLRRSGDLAGFRKLLQAGGQALLAIARCPKPVVCALDGAAAGAGLSMALACDLRLASTRAAFTMAFVRIGLVPDWGSSYLLPRVVGPAAALELSLTGRKIDAKEAFRLGLVQEVVEHDQFPRELARRVWDLAALPPHALSGIKRLLRQEEQWELEKALAAECQAQIRCFRDPGFAPSST